MNLRKEARNRDCQVRIDGVCNGNSETTVLAHLSIPGISGMGMKCNDLIATWACGACHMEIDGQTHNYRRTGGDMVNRMAINILASDGMKRTLTILHNEGKI